MLLFKAVENKYPLALNNNKNLILSLYFNLLRIYLWLIHRFVSTYMQSIRKRSNNTLHIIECTYFMELAYWNGKQ